MSDNLTRDTNGIDRGLVYSREETFGPKQEVIVVESSECSATELKELRAERDDLDFKLRNLLARIHRDDGYYTNHNSVSGSWEVAAIKLTNLIHNYDALVVDQKRIIEDLEAERIKVTVLQETLRIAKAETLEACKIMQCWIDAHDELWKNAEQDLANLRAEWDSLLSENNLLKLREAAIKSRLALAIDLAEMVLSKENPFQPPVSLSCKWLDIEDIARRLLEMVKERV